jgi:hypothetical protein
MTDHSHNIRVPSSVNSSVPFAIKYLHYMVRIIQHGHYVRPGSLNLLFCRREFGLVVGVVVSLMLAVFPYMPYARGCVFDSLSGLYLLCEPICVSLRKFTTVQHSSSYMFIYQILSGLHVKRILSDLCTYRTSRTCIPDENRWST